TRISREEGQRPADIADPDRRGRDARGSQERVWIRAIETPVGQSAGGCQRSRWWVTRGASPTKLNFLARGCWRKIDGRGDESARITAPSLPSAQWIRVRTTQRRVIAAGDEYAAGCNNVGV